MNFSSIALIDNLKMSVIVGMGRVSTTPFTFLLMRHLKYAREATKMYQSGKMQDKSVRDVSCADWYQKR